MKFINLDSLFGRRGGIIREIASAQVPQSEPDLHIFNATRGALPAEIELNSDGQMGSGCGDYVESLLSCCGELVERYCCGFVANDLLVGNFENLSKNYNLANTESFNFFSKSQYAQENFPFCYLEASSNIRWAKTIEMTENVEYYIPAFSIYLPYNQEQNIYTVNTSTGLSCSSSFETGFMSSLLEIIERDAFTIFWIHQLSPPKIVFPDEARYNKLRKKFRMDEINYILLDITSDFGVPTVAALSFGESSFGYVAALGLGCNFCPYKAISKALNENVQARLAIFHHRKTKITKTFRPDFQDIEDFTDHILLYSTDRQLYEKIRFIEKSPHIIDASQMKTINCNELVSLFAQKKYPIFTKDITTKDMEQVGLKVVRSVAPDLVQLHGIHRFPFLGSKRLREPHNVFSWVQHKVDIENNFLCFPPHLLG